MQAKLLTNDAEKTFALDFETGDEAMAGPRDFARKMKLGGSHFTAIGAFSEVTLAYFDWELRKTRFSSPAFSPKSASRAALSATERDCPNSIRT